MRKIIALLCAGMLVLGAAGTALAGNRDLPVPKYRKVSVHDPSVIRAEDGTFYIFGSHMQAAKSDDLMQWKMFSRDANMGCTLVENVQQEMKEALDWAKTVTFWAPDVRRLADGRYYLYYCTCEGSSPLSALGVAVSDGPEGPYRNLGVFLKSGMPGYDATVLPNVIDPNVFYDAEGMLWMVYGSYSGGIYILQMDPDTGFPLPDQGYGRKLLGKNHARIEAPYILYSPETEYYYLFLSFGGLNANDGYNIRVCRSKKPDGPYLDAQGQDMILCGGADGTYFHDPDYEPYGVKLMGGYCFDAAEWDASRIVPSYRSPGHNSAYYDAETGRYFLIFHTRFAGQGENYQVRVHCFYLNEDGWPVVSPLAYAGEMPETVGREDQPGTYKILLHGHDINTAEKHSELVSLNEDGTVTGAKEGAWSCGDGRNLSIELDGIRYRGVLHTALDAANKQWVTCFSALDETGAALWGVHAAEPAGQE